MRRIRFATLAIAASLLAVSGTAWAHDSRPMLMEITEVGPGLFSVEWKVPPSVPRFNLPEPILPADSTRRGEEIAVDRRDGYLRKRLYDCPDGLAGQEVGLRYPVLNPSLSCLVRVQLLNGQRHSKLLGPDETTWRIPERETRLGVSWEYALLGVRHIWGGIDHLLFLVCLLLVAGTSRRILITITGFTVAHSLTLILSALGLVRLPVVPVEATISLSIVFLASEIARGAKGSLTYRYPIAVSSSFGLLHGFAFAAVLREIGLPQTELVTSLLFFNVGVEIGQVLFIACLLVGFWLLLLPFRARAGATQAGPGLLTRIEKPAVYAVGSLASLWLIQRVSSFWL